MSIEGWHRRQENREKLSKTSYSYQKLFKSLPGFLQEGGPENIPKTPINSRELSSASKSRERFGKDIARHGGAPSLLAKSAFQAVIIGHSVTPEQRRFTIPAACRKVKSRDPNCLRVRMSRTRSRPARQSAQQYWSGSPLIYEPAEWRTVVSSSYCLACFMRSYSEANAFSTGSDRLSPRATLLTKVR